MKGHLSSKQISKYMAGCSSPSLERHVKECQKCAAEVDRMKMLFTEFRNSASALSVGYKEFKTSNPLQSPAHSRKYTFLTLKWACAVFVLARIILSPISLNDRRREMEQLKADVQLCKEVDAQVSQTIPEPLAPLMQLVAWDPDKTE
jgi:hypothetical protein